MRAVADSSVLISAFLRPGPPRAVFIAARQQRFTVCLSSILLEEIRRGLLKERNRARYDYAAEQVEAFVAALADGAIIVRRLPAIQPVCRDPNDDHVLAAALAARAECIVTGDADLLELVQHRGVRILTVRAFLEQL